MGCLDNFFDFIPLSNKISRAMDFRPLAIAFACLSILYGAFELFLMIALRFNIISFESFDWYFTQIEEPSVEGK